MRLLARAILGCTLGALMACAPRDPIGDTASTSASNSSTGQAGSTGATGTTLAPTSAGSTGPGSSGTTCGPFDPNDCGEARLEVPIVAPDLVFVLGDSPAMVSGQWDHDGDDGDDDGVSDLDPMLPATPKVPRWASLFRALQQTLESFDPSMNAGLSLYPSASATNSYGPAACPVAPTIEVPVGPLHGIEILAAIPPETAMNLTGATPGAAAVAAATMELLAIDDAAPRRIIYVAGEAANCHAGAMTPDALLEIYDDDLDLRVADAFEAGILTHVVGVGIPDATSPALKDGHPDGVNNFTRLGELAVTGGAPLPAAPFFRAASDELELGAALEAILRAELSCTVALDPLPKFPDQVEITVNGLIYPKVDDCSDADGWHFLDTATIELCGAACRDFQEVGSLDATYRCPPDPCG